MKDQKGKTAFTTAGRIRSTTAVFIHGAGGSQAIWQQQFQAFTETVSCLFLDLPGHGHSSGETLDSIEGYADWLGSFLDEHSIDQPILIGHSMGSAIVLQLALSRQNVRGLVLVGAGARLRVAPLIIETIRTNFQKATALVASNLFASPELDPLFKQVEQDMIICGAAGLLDDFAACDRFDVMGQLSGLHPPTLAITGSKDVMTPPKYSQFLATHMPACRLVVVEGAGHMVMAEKAAEFNTTVRSFLSGLVTPE